MAQNLEQKQILKLLDEIISELKNHETELSNKDDQSAQQKAIELLAEVCKKNNIESNRFYQNNFFQH